MSKASDFLGGGGGGNLLGLPSLPSGRGVVANPSPRTIPILTEVTTDYIRCPNESNANNTGIGFRRITADGSAGGSEWSVSWIDLSTFGGGDTAQGYSSQILNYTISSEGNLHVLVYTSAGQIIPSAASCIIVYVVSIGTGAILSITEISEAGFLGDNVSNFQTLINSGYLTYDNGIYVLAGSTYNPSTYSRLPITKITFSNSEILTEEYIGGTFGDTPSDELVPDNVIFYPDDKSYFVTSTSAVYYIYIDSGGISGIIPVGSMNSDKTGIGAGIYDIADSTGQTPTRRTVYNAGVGVSAKRELDLSANFDEDPLHYSLEDFDKYWRDVILAKTGIQL